MKQRTVATILRQRIPALALGLLLISTPTLGAPPAEVTSLQFCPGSKTCLSWSNLGSVQYRVYRGTQTTLPALANASVDSCLVRMMTGTTTTGSAIPEAPPSGSLLWYLVTAKNCDGEGAAGNGATGPRTVNVSGDCVTATCADGIQNGSETDVDCGGGGCPACINAKACCAGASCATGFCQSGSCASAPNGFACLTGSQCTSSFCIDSVCCNSSCSAVCAACNQAGSAGTCGPLPAGTDPGSECGGVSCSIYYWGWSGDTCYRKANVTAAQATCGGASACRTAPTECSLQSSQGSAALSCHPTCQDPTAGTCTGTTQGTCTNVNPGNQTCGQGICLVSRPQCVGGAPNTCVPGTPTTETCNGLDDDCDGATDNHLTPPTNFCSSQGVCAGQSIPVVCTGPGGWRCNYSNVPNVDLDAGGNLRATESHCADGRDNNCNGVIDDGCP